MGTKYTGMVCFTSELNMTQSCCGNLLRVGVTVDLGTGLLWKALVRFILVRTNVGAVM